ncbi:serine/threonine-protein kinase [Gemmatirosa kalamazoonensis]|uniref:serine/threonine-protein kinase n=1 Tax=Gemmatirosa kalamazoonensis TaxID=861299 RepID=UPI0004B240CA|nr:serine/threonine-protein kinase [Gemmatirosa kalamazoonensis]
MRAGVRDELQAAFGAAYRVERELDGGGMSRVFVATEVALGREVVVKVLPPELTGAISVERFRREIAIAARLQHAHIVPLLAAGESSGDDRPAWAPLLYYTMPFVRGESVRARLTRVGALPIAESVSVARDVASALAYAHREGVVHRDIKPENVLLTEHDAVVVDFGVAKALRAAATDASALTSAGLALGTPSYMAPEQATADPLADHRVDLYALGVLAYEMLAGTPPFAGRGAQALIAAHVAEPPEPIEHRRPDVPPALAALVMRCLAKNPADRPPTADEIVRALDALDVRATPADTSVTPHATRPPEPDARRTTRRTLGIAALASAAVLVGGGAWIASRLRDPPVLVDRDAVAVLPFRVVGGDASLRLLREGIPDLVAALLTGRVHAVDVRTVLAAWRAAGGERLDLPRDAAMLLARRVGAGAVIEGSAIVAPGSLSLDGTLLSAHDGRERHASARGAATALPALLDSVVGKLLALDAGENDERATALAGVPLAALQHYLEGRSLERAGRYNDATAAYARAMDADSTFALAALRLWLTSTNWTPSARAADAHRLVARYADRLGPRDRLLLGSTAELERPRTCAESLREHEQGVAQAPDMPDLWYLLGETLVHCGPAMGIDDALRRALNAFDRVLALDSSYAGVRDHYAPTYHLLGDTARERRAVDAALHDPALADSRLFTGFIQGDSATMRAALAELERGPAWMAGAALGLAVTYAGGTRAEAAEPLLARVRRAAVTTADRDRAERQTREFTLTRGQPSRAAAAMRASPGGVDTAFALLAALFWDGDSTLARSVRDGARRTLDAPLDTAPSRNAVLTAFAVGEDAAARRDTASTRRAIAALRSVPASPAAPWSNAPARRFALLLDAQIAALERRSDAHALLVAADSMLREGPGGRELEGAGNLIVASLWEREGDLPRALAATGRRRVDTSIPFAFSTYLRERARLAERGGAREEAIRAYRHYLTLRRNAEPSFAVHLASVRDALARLERASAGR